MIATRLSVKLALDFFDPTEEKIKVMKNGKLKYTAVMHDPGVSPQHQKDAVQKKRRKHRWVMCQIPHDTAPSSEAHELGRATAIASNDSEVLAEVAAADAKRQINASLANS